MKVKKKPIEVEAWAVVELIRQANDEWDALPQPIIDAYEAGELIIHANSIDVETMGTWHRAEPDDYIIRGVAGEFYPIKPEIFRQTYEVIE